MHISGNPGPQGLYDPRFEHDACGVAFVVDMKGRPSHEIVRLAITALLNLEHRGATGAEENTGDGAGILLQMPDAFLRDVADINLPEAGSYAAGMAFLPRDREEAAFAAAGVEAIASSEGFKVLGWRDVPIDDSMIGEQARAMMPTFRQVFLSANGWTGMDLERRAFIVRKRIEHEVGNVYFPSLSARTLVYKGMLSCPQLPDFFPDLKDERMESALALVHSRFSTNTFPSWPLAHPYRIIAHNGEINTLQGNRNWMRAREALLESEVLPGDVERIFPVITPGASDSASFDECLELLHMAGRSLPHAVLMMIPEAWENHRTMKPERRAFYQYHSSLMEPWDGPASIAFTDGTVIGAVLDRNGLRPSRYWVTDDDLVVMASEVGVLDIDPAKIVKKGRLQPGKIFLVDTSKGRIVGDDEIKDELAREHPYGDWLHAGLMHLADLPPRTREIPTHESVLRRQQTFGYTEEELRVLIAPMAMSGAEPVGSMGNDAPLAALSDRSRLLFDYFRQLFAQVTNPPLDAIREELVTAMGSTLGPEQNLLVPGPAACRQIVLPYPIIDNDELAKLVHIDDDGNLPGFRSMVFSGLYPVKGGGKALREALDAICTRVSDAIADGIRIIILSDRHSTASLAPIPSLLLTSAVHHHLIREKSRTKVGLVIETGDAREVHHMACLIGYGAGAVNPYLAFETVEDLIARGDIAGIDPKKAVYNYVKALGKSVLKTMSKMGISTVASYTGAQVFEAIGLSQDLVDEYFTGTVSKLGGIDLDGIAREVAARHALAYPDRSTARAHRGLEFGGHYQWRREGEFHLFNPDTIALLQHAVRTGDYSKFKQYARTVDDQSRSLGTLRGLFKLREGMRSPVPIEEVEPVEEIVKRFATGAMSYGSISKESHETLAIAMNRIGGRSNSGEGGEDPERDIPDANGDSRRSRIRQVASARFGVTSQYLANADDLQIKIAQGAKPGEGGQLPGKKVYPWIAKTRFATPGVGLISPPPHHDIYSIEDIAQLIHDLKNSNPQARVHVKLVAEVGVGTVAAGVCKAKSDVVLISGHDGGTGASPLSSVKHAGGPWELGLAETQQTLLLNGLRDRIVVQVDGQLKTGRDVVIGALLGADEFGFATAPLVSVGCIMMRVCHLDLCPVGIATQNPELRKRFDGEPEHVVHYMLFVAQEVREYLAALGFRTLQEAIGQVELIDVEPAIKHWKTDGIDLAPILHVPQIPDGAVRHHAGSQDHGLDKALDNELIEVCAPALQDGTPVSVEMPIRNVNRTVGTMLGYHVTKKWGGDGLPDDTIKIHFTGSAGQSFGAFVPKGVTLRLEGDANDYVGKGLSGGKVILHPHHTARFKASENIIAGNVILYGATSGEAYIRGVVGERFCVRNSGATAVVEGVGDHGCEYMTGGRAVILGQTGRNFGAGMSGGLAYIYDPDGAFPSNLNTDMVDLEPLDDEDLRWLEDTIGKHYAATQSAVAYRILADWYKAAESFLKVMPKDYKRVLEATRLAQETGRSVEDAVMAAAHG
ncbi:MAG TPA: glutamate synthase large subunit [Actinomycetota bacterium]|nr:glutamate synthase large subunit [Actinomycetota bacterium]